MKDTDFARGVGAADVERGVSGAGIDDDNFVTPGQRIKSQGNAMRLVLADDAGRDKKHETLCPRSSTK